MDLDWLKKQVDACLEEGDRLNTDGPAYAELCEYIDNERGVERLRAQLELKDIAYRLSETLSEQRRQERDGDRTELVRVRTHALNTFTKYREWINRYQPIEPVVEEWHWDHIAKESEPYSALRAAATALARIANSPKPADLVAPVVDREELDLRHVRLRAALHEALELARALSNNIVKFPAEGGPTMTDRRIEELQDFLDGKREGL